MSGQPDGTTLACNPLVAPPKSKSDVDDDDDDRGDTDGKFLSGKVVLVDRGACAFTVKALNIQNAGDEAMIVADNAAGSPPPGLPNRRS